MNSGTRFLHIQEPVPVKFKNELPGFCMGTRFRHRQEPVPEYKNSQFCKITLGTRFLPTGNRFPRPITAFSATFDSIMHPLSFANFLTRIVTLETPIYSHFTPL